MTSIITYEQMKNFYSEFKKNPPQDEFNRYYKEYSYTKSLVELAKAEDLKTEAKVYEQIQKNAMEQLKKLGYNFI